MTVQKLDIYVVLAKATASKENQKYSEGEKHAVLAFAKASSHSEAEAVAMKGLADSGWMNLEIDKTGTVDSIRKESHNPTDDTFNTALDEGFAAVIYEDVEP